MSFGTSAPSRRRPEAETILDKVILPVRSLSARSFWRVLMVGMVGLSGVATGLKIGATGSGWEGVGSGFGATGETVFSIFSRAEEKSSGGFGFWTGGMARRLYPSSYSGAWFGRIGGSRSGGWFGPFSFGEPGVRTFDR